MFICESFSEEKQPNKSNYVIVPFFTTSDTNKSSELVKKFVKCLYHEHVDKLEKKYQRIKIVGIIIQLQKLSRIVKLISLFCYCKDLIIKSL